MSRKWFLLAAWALLWIGLAGSAQDTSRQNTVLTTAPTQPGVQTPGVEPPAPAQKPAETTLLPVENQPIHLTPSPANGTPGLKERMVQAHQEIVDSAKKDLAQREGISVEDVTVLAVIGQEYSPDAFYCRTTKGRIAKDEPTGLISGETILLEAGGSRYEYHANAPLVVYCRHIP